ncbi:hypothetical protein HYW94_02735, partial [Candidatus Uhrbacteria bacterium]|nr:hypothetical protein [Candidatus Uhrbacteria bacterium]
QGGDAELEVGAQGHISFTTGGIAGSATERMRINDKGNVGIGTTTPADLLTLSGTGKFVRVDENSTGNSGIVVSLNSTNKGFFGVTGAANGFITGSAVGDVVLRTQSQKLLISTDGGTTANLIVGTTGNVGIGTAEPTINGGGLEISRVGQVAVRVSDTENGGKKAEFGADSAGGFIQTLSDGANLRFFTGNALGPRIVIDSEGKVGIGTTTPAYKLDVNGNINTSNQLCIKGDCRDWGSISSASAQNFVHKTDTLGTNTNGTNAVNCGGAEDDWSSCNYGKAPIIWTQEIQVRPDGITGAVGKLFQTGGSGGDYRTQLHTASHGMADVRGKTFTFSFWVKPSVDTTIQSVFRRAGDKDTFASNTCGLTANTWKRCILTGTAGTVDNSSLSDNSALHVYLNINSEVSYYVYGAQLESGSIATAYQPKGPNTYENGYFGGNVGIGTTSPGAKLDVAGNVNVSGNVSSTGLCINGDCKTAWGEISNVGEKPRALLISYATWYPNEGSNDPDKGAPTWTWLKKNNYFSVADVDISLNADQLAAKDYDIYIIDNYAWSVGNASSKAYDLWKKYGKNVITIGNDSDTGTYPITGYIEWNKNTWGSTSGYASSADANHIITRNYRSATNIGDYGDTGKIITSVSSEFIALYKKTGDPTKITGIIGESERGGIWFHDQTGYLTGTSNGQKILGNVISYMSGSNLEMLRNRVANIGERNIQNVLYTDQKNLRVGIGTTTPEKILHINGSGNNGLLVSAAGKNTKISLHIADRDYGYLNLGGSGVTATEIRGNGQSSNFGGNIYVNGTIQATEFKIGTSTVIDSTGKWKGDPTGLQGPPGMVWKGEWKKDINYKINDVVFCDYSSWIAIQNNDGKIAPPSCGGAPTEGAPSKGTTPIWGGGVGIQPSKPALGGGTFATKRITDSNGTGGANASSNNNKAWEYWNLLAKRGDPGQPGINGVSPFMTGTNRDIYYTGGNVGIGTTTPAYKLDVNGNMQITGNFVSKGEISVSSSITQYTKSGNAIRGTGNPECSFTIKDTSPEDIYTGNSTDGDWCYYNYRGRRSKFKQLFQVQIQVKKTFFTLNGSVGIGTATPGATLDIVGNRGDVNNRNFKVTYPGGNLDGTELSGLTHLESELKMGWTALYAKKGSANYAGVFNGDIIVKNGKLGINTTNPLAMLDVNGGEINVSALDRGLLSAVDPKQKLALSRDRIGLDVAELYETSEDVEVGDVLVIGEKDKKLEKSSKSYQGEIVGIVSGSPALLFEGSDLKLGSKPDRFIRGTKPPVALAGRVPVKVSLENGPIHSGDYLTSSSIAGVAMRATEPGNTVGVALENYSGWGDGTVLVFVNIGEKNTSAAIKELQKTNQDLQKRLDEIEKKVR